VDVCRASWWGAFVHGPNHEQGSGYQDCLALSYSIAGCAAFFGLAHGLLLYQCVPRAGRQLSEVSRASCPELIFRGSATCRVGKGGSEGVKTSSWVLDTGSGYFGTAVGLTPSPHACGGSFGKVGDSTQSDTLKRGGTTVQGKYGRSSSHPQSNRVAQHQRP
jgi:hypothetical protein